MEDVRHPDKMLAILKRAKFLLRRNHISDGRIGNRVYPRYGHVR
jgi:hypothetical protein